MVYKTGDGLKDRIKDLERELAELKEELADEKEAAMEFENNVLDYLERMLGDRAKASEELDVIVFGSREAYEADKALRGAGTPQERLARAIAEGHCDEEHGIE